ncbi:MAG: hypothetical protein NC132_02555 [Corallococcus sp.]|nr:hypothetical protein [Corallococcus sp.]MCM1358989.1 hypothetical protein [Corallococcus sp.]MCM1394978.1 hypothetical protein [Corallococcus sp.]
MKLKTVKPKKQKQGKSKIRRHFPKKCLPVVAFVVCVAAVLAAVLPFLPQKPQQTQPLGYKGVLELWNVETFEGGSGSRSSWLTSRAAKFEAQNKGLFVHVTNVSEEQLQQKLDNGESFDMICFSRGVGAQISGLLQKYRGSVADVCDNLLVSGQISGSVYALPLYAGVYCLFARTNQLPPNADLLSVALSATYTRKIGKTTYDLQPIICGFTRNNSPMSALALSGGKGEANVSEEVTQYSAYESFVGNKTAVTLLGTQRDLYRLGKKEEMGKIEELTFAPLTGYTDLVQYLGISSACGDKSDSCNAFLQYVVGRDSQQSLVNVDMFSVLMQSFYTDKRYALCEQGVKTAYVPNVFGDGNAVATQRQTALDTLRIN